MSTKQQTHADAVVDDIYGEAEHWVLNTGEQTIHAKRMPGKWRLIKWLTSSVWLVFFLGPYLRWGDRQAVLFDIPNRQFHIFNLTILPQDFWMLSLVLLFFAILLAVVTTIAGRVWCGYFCFQTVWIDVFTWIEEKVEGPPQKRRKLDGSSMDFAKFRVKALKHFAWLLISLLTGISFVAWFTDAYQLWVALFRFDVNVTASAAIALFTAGTYGLAGFLREQACLWLCPYARIQSVMVDRTTVIPTYDVNRGEPRTRVKKGASTTADRKGGDCVDCHQCVAVCPTGVDIREGLQEGCIMCALCLDACDSVMEKLNRPKGLIRYESLDGLNGQIHKPLWQRPRVWIYTGILSASVLGVAYGLSRLDAVELNVIRDRQPLYVIQSDGTIQNKYTLKILNKLTHDVQLQVSASGPEGLMLIDADEPVAARPGKVTPKTLFVKVPQERLKDSSVPILFSIQSLEPQNRVGNRRESVFMGPGS